MQASLHPDANSAPRKRGRYSILLPPAGEMVRNGSGREIPENASAGEFFDRIPDDLIILVLSKVSSSASCPSDFINARLSCKRLYSLCLNGLVLSKASVKLFAIKAKGWSESAHRFLGRCAIAGNLESCYVLGMIRFYCFGKRLSGIHLIKWAAIGLHAPAIYSLAVILFNGSGYPNNTKYLQAAVALCARAASLGHLDAIRELGHSLQDGYGVRRDVLQGRRYLMQANLNELVDLAKALKAANESNAASLAKAMNPTNEPHPVNLFMTEWFAPRLDILWKYGLKLCSNKGCGRPETRRNEFRRCSMCGLVRYCSRACQAVDWKASHKMACPMLEGLFIVQLPAVVPDDADVEGGIGGGDDNGERDGAEHEGGRV